MAEKTGLIAREYAITSERNSSHNVYYSTYPLNENSLAGQLINYIANVLTKESDERKTLVPRKPEELSKSGGIIFILDCEGEALVKSGSPEKITEHIQGMAHLGLLHKDLSDPDRITDVEIRGVKSVGGNGAGAEAIMAAAELARERFPNTQLFIMVNDGSEITMEKLKNKGLMHYVVLEETKVPEEYFKDCANCPVKPTNGRRCCHTVLAIH